MSHGHDVPPRAGYASMKATVMRLLRRGLALLADALFLGVIIRPQLLIGFPTDPPRLIDAASELIRLLLVAAYFVGCHARWGRTLGKMVFGLRVMTIDGFSPPPWRAAFRRYAPLLTFNLVLFVVDWFILPNWRIGVMTVDRTEVSFWRLALYAWILAECMAAIRTNGYRSIHDLIGRTAVTDERARRKAPDVTSR